MGGSGLASVGMARRGAVLLPRSCGAWASGGVEASSSVDRTTAKTTHPSPRSSKKPARMVGARQRRVFAGDGMERGSCLEPEEEGADMAGL